MLHCWGCAVFLPPDADSQLCRLAGEQTTLGVPPSEKSRDWALTVTFLCNLDLSIYTSAAVLFIDMTPLYLLSAENRCSLFTDHKSKFGHNSGAAKI